MTTGNSASTAPRARGRHRITISGTAIASYVGVFLLVITLVMVGYQPPVRQADAATVSSVATSTSSTSTTSVPAATVDQLTATNLASSLAESTDLPVRYDVSSLSQTLLIASSLEQVDSSTITKPTIIQPAADNSNVKHYTTVNGDTVNTIASKFGISPTTVKWANGLTSDAVTTGTDMKILPVDGVLYTVRSGDTLESIATKYKGNKEEIVAINSLEVSGLPQVGTEIIIPHGELPNSERPGYVAPVIVAATTGGSWSSGGTWATAQAWTGARTAFQGYPFGQCTWYAAYRRAQLGNPVGSMWGNGGYWRYSGAAAGRLVDGNPTAGAVMDGLGHVAVVESVEPGVRIFISEMNGYRGGGGWGRIGFIIIPWGEATGGLYKYVH